LGVQNEPQSIFLEEYEASDDHTVHRIRIKEGIPYHDNNVKDEVTANDFKFTLRRISESDEQHRVLIEPYLNLEYETADDGIGSFNVAPDSIAVNVLNDYTFELTVSDPDPHLLRKLSDILFAPIPEGIVGDVQGYDGERSIEEFGISSPVGCGAYQIEAYDGDEVVLSRFDDYHGEKPSIPEIRFQILDRQTAFEKLSEGELDAGPLPAQSYNRDAISVDSVNEAGVRTGNYTLSDGTELDYMSAELPLTFYLGMRADEIPRDVRRAICHAFDRDWVVEHLPTVRKIKSFVPGSIWPQGYEQYREFAAASPYSAGSDLAAAEQELADRSGAYDMTLSVYQEGGKVIKESGAGSKLQNLLGEIGINLDIQEFPYLDFVQMGRQRELESFYFGWADIHADPLSYLSQIGPNETVEGSSAIWINWSSGDAEHADRAQEAYRNLEKNLGDEQQLAETITTMERARREDAVILPLFNYPLKHISHQWVDFPTPSPAGQAHTRHAQSEFADVPARLRE